MNMLRRSWILSVCALMLLAVNPVSAKKKSVMEKGTYEDWKDLIDKVEIVEPFQVGSYTKVVVVPLKTDKTPLPEKDDNTYEPVTTILAKVTDLFIGGLKRTTQGKLEIASAEQPPSGEAAKGVLIVRGEVSEMNPGSMAKRFWVGFGAGKSRVEITGEVVSAETGAILLKFTHARVYAMGPKGWDYSAMLTDGTDEVGGDIGEMLLSF